MNEMSDMTNESAGIPRKWIILAVVKVVLLLVAVGVVFSLYGCNTVRGIGQDIEKAGDAIQRSTR
jgi:predicted small secreted protein